MVNFTPIGRPGASTSTGRLHPDDLTAIMTAVRVESPWLSATEAAQHIRAPLSRVRKLTMLGEIPHEHDGRRVLYHRDQLDEYIRSGGSTSP